MGNNDNLSMSDLTHKTVMPMALTCLARSADLTSLSLEYRKYNPEGVIFAPTTWQNNPDSQKY